MLGMAAAVRRGRKCRLHPPRPAPRAGEELQHWPRQRRLLRRPRGEHREEGDVRAEAVRSEILSTTIILSAAKDLHSGAAFDFEILRCAQDDGWALTAR